MNGMTLLELLVAIAILGIGLTVSALSFAPLFERDRTRAAAKTAALAISSGIGRRVMGDSAVPPIYYLPDGRAVGHADPLIGGLRAGH